MSNSPLYLPYKIVGYVTDSNPFVVTRLGEETFITTSIGRAFQIYRLDHLIVSLVSRSCDAKITCFQVSNHETFAAVNNEIKVYDRNRIVRTYKEHLSRIIGLCLVGDILLSYDENNLVKILNIKQREVIGEINTLQPSKISIILHPATYLNKFIFAYMNGEIELWNIRKESLIYTFISHKKYLQNIYGLDDTNQLPGVSCMEQSPACDVIGVGFTSGDILLINLKLDKVLFSFTQDTSVCTLSFRTDAVVEKFPLMASGSTDGRIHVWHLGGGSSDNKERRLLSTIEDAHCGTVSRVHFLHGEPLLVTSAADNSIKVWIFDAPDGSARILRSREGPSGSLLSHRHYGGEIEASMRESAEATSCELLCATDNGSFRLLNAALPAHSRELSQQTVLKKLGMQRRNVRLPTVIDFDFSETRQRDWGNIVSIHKNHDSAYVWRHKHRTITEIILRQPHWKSNEMMHHSDRSTHSTAISVSCCGNFCAVGSRGGIIYMYNLQSGLPRGAFPASAEKSSIKAGTLKTRTATLGNVFYESKSVLSREGPVVGKGSLKAIGPHGGKANITTNNRSNNSIKGVGIVTGEDIDNIKGHESEITGIFIDPCSGTLASCGLDGLLIFWDLSSHELLFYIKHKSPQLKMFSYRDGGFIALIGQDRIIRIYDMNNKKLIRRFDGHSREITGLAFTPDGRRLLSSSLDATVRVWDMPTGRCLSWMKFDRPVMSVGISLSGDQMSLVLAEKEGIHMYIDRSLYETVHFWHEPKEPCLMKDCKSKLDEIDNENEIDQNNTDKEHDQNNIENKNHSQLDNENAVDIEVRAPQGQVESESIRESSVQRSTNAITMSNVPKAYWITLFHLEEIKARNKAKEPPKAPAQAPFFLPTVVRGGGATPSFPTPDEFQNMNMNMNSDNNNNNNNSNSNNVLDKDTTNTTTVQTISTEQGIKRKIIDNDTTTTTTSLSKKGKVTYDDMSQLSPETIEAELAMLGSVWKDDDEDIANEDDGIIDTESRVVKSLLSDDMNISNNNGDNDDVVVTTTASSKSKKSKTNPNSRIIRRECSLAGILFRAYPLEISVRFPDRIGDNNSNNDNYSFIPEDFVADDDDYRVSSYLT
eukprot:gene5529-11138_t